MKGGSRSQEVMDIVKEEVNDIMRREVKEQIAHLQFSMDEEKGMLSILIK